MFFEECLRIVFVSFFCIVVIKECVDGVNLVFDVVNDFSCVIICVRNKFEVIKILCESSG